MQKLYIVRFGFSRGPAGEATGISQGDAAKAVERVARLTGLPPYSLKFEPRAWFNNEGAAHVEHAGEVEFIGGSIETEARRFATALRMQLKQEAVTMQVQPVESFNFV
jgi:hypothetical protein